MTQQVKLRDPKGASLALSVFEKSGTKSGDLSLMKSHGHSNDAKTLAMHGIGIEKTSTGNFTSQANGVRERVARSKKAGCRDPVCEGRVKVLD
jgi:hypothetical protein